MSGSTVGALLVTAILWAAPTRALQDTDPVVRALPGADTTSYHTVVDGDTLWSLAEAFYGDSDLWVVLYEANRPAVEGPNRLRPGQRLEVPPGPASPAEVAPRPATSGTPSTGRARLATIAVGQGGSAPVRDASAPVPVRRAAPVLPESGPAPATATGAEPDGLAPTEAAPIPSTLLASAPFLLSAHQVDDLVDSLAPSPLRAARRGDRVQLDVAGLEAEGALEIGHRLQAIHLGRRLEGGGGVVATPTGVLRIAELSGTSAVAVVESVFGRVAPGDRVRRLPAASPSSAEVIPVSSGPELAVLATAVSRPILQPGDWVFLDADLPGGVEVGDEFVPAWMADAGRRPGRLQVVRVESTHATARILRVGGSSFEPGQLVRLDRRRR